MGVYGRQKRDGAIIQTRQPESRVERVSARRDAGSAQFAQSAALGQDDEY